MEEFASEIAKLLPRHNPHSSYHHNEGGEWVEMQLEIDEERDEVEMMGEIVADPATLPVEEEGEDKIWYLGVCFDGLLRAPVLYVRRIGREASLDAIFSRVVRQCASGNVERVEHDVTGTRIGRFVVSTGEHPNNGSPIVSIHACDSEALLAHFDSSHSLIWSVKRFVQWFSIYSQALHLHLDAEACARILLHTDPTQHPATDSETRKEGDTSGGGEG